MISTLDNCVLELVKAGLWEKEIYLSSFGEVDWNSVYTIAEEQAVTGLVTAGLEQVRDVKVPQEVLLAFIGSTLQIEQRNKGMNAFICGVITKMQERGVYSLLVKGQGVAQCYERPLWRVSGDIDFYLSDSNYESAKALLIPLADYLNQEDKEGMNLELTIDSWLVELHASMHEELSNRMNKVIDIVHDNVFCKGEVRSWNNDGVTVFLPSPNNDVVIVFTHFLQHFFIGGVGLRQICDWCRLLWTFRNELDLKELKSMISKAGLMSEWKVFASIVVNALGMPKTAMPFYDARFKIKGERALKRILKSGNFGHNNDLSYRLKYSGLRYKAVAIWKRFWDFSSLVSIFPIDAPKFFVRYLTNKL